MDVSRSMFRSDLLGKSRMYWALITIKEIIERKHKIDPNDRFSIIFFSDSTVEADQYFYDFPTLFEFIFETAEIIGKTQLHLDRAVKSIIKEKRKIGQKLFRIIIISDGYIHPTVSNPIKFAKVAKDLGIICDAVRYGKSMISGNILKRVVEVTGGTYYYIQDEDEYLDVIKKVAEKKKLKVATLLDDLKDDSLDNMSKDIASPLLKFDDLSDEQRDQINFEFKDLKCQICHSGLCMMCETGFYGCGRFCPSCLKPLHLHCALKWSESQQNNSTEAEDHKILRCPFCYYLLKIPIMLHKERVKVSSSSENIIKKIKFTDETSELMTSICAHPDCGIMFDESTDAYVYKCNACGSFFHSDCLLKDATQSGKCPYCKTSSTVVD